MAVGGAPGGDQTEGSKPFLAQEAVMVPHHRSHWFVVAVVVVLALMALEAGGQVTGAQAMFEGRPALAGAQGGLGAQAGPAQGGIALQGTDGAEFNLRKPRIIEEAAAAKAAAAAQAEQLAVLEADRALPPKVDADATPAQMRSAARAAR
jgi:hypothetical protein